MNRQVLPLTFWHRSCVNRSMEQPLQPLPARHTVFDDTQGIFTGTLFVSLALLMFNQAGLLTGGTAGLAFVLHYATGVSFGKLFFLVNLPFYWFS